MSNHNSPAFPFCFTYASGEVETHRCVSARDYFALHILSGWLTSGPCIAGNKLSGHVDDAKTMVTMAYNWADVMLEIRAK
jgi:hypothetical protein